MNDDTEVDDYEPRGNRDPREIAREPKTEEEIQARIDMLLSGDRTEEFLVELERRMIAGYTYRQRRTWAKAEYSIGEDAVNKIEALIRHGQKLESIAPMAIATKREQRRQQYLLVYQRAMEVDDFKNAIKALDSLCKLEGLMAPDTTLNVNVQADITSQTREKVAGLFNRMRELAQQREDLLKRGRVIEAQSIQIHDGDKK